jgi:fumarate reductase subunit C
MSIAAKPAHSEYHPRWYRRKIGTFWWLGSWPYTRFIVRELTSVPVAWFVVLTIALVVAIANGPSAYDRYSELMKEPLMVFVNGLAFVFLLYHSITWFNLAPKAMVVKLGDRPVPGILIAGANFGGWFAVSIGIALLVTWS